MKPCNFPERKNQRRKAALERANKRLDTITMSHPDHLQWTPDIARKIAACRSEIQALTVAIADSARHIRTKKRRTGPRKLQTV